ncbi:MAG: response regulator [Deltaproteobacteria bacterium]|nr:MAG: response regulator [Deltaproteobacteria bacterium]
MIDIKNMSVLIVDDMENMCKSIRGMMKVLEYGKKFRFANNGKEAWNLLKKEPSDIAITDWNMPVMTGVELLERIREDRELRDMPVVMVTAEANREIVAEAAEADIDFYILKPLTVKTLGSRIAYMVEKANNPSPVVRHLKQALIKEEQGDIDGAIVEVLAAMDADPDSSRPARELGYLYYKKGDFKNAEKYYIKAAHMNKLDVIAFHRLGELYLEKNDIDNAIKFLEKAISISPRHVSRGVNFGKILVQKGMKQKAVGIFKKAISISDDSIALREEIAAFCLEYEMFKFGVELMTFIVENVPGRHDLLLKIASAFEKLNENENAIRYLLEAESHMKDDVDIKIRLARLYMSMQQTFRADSKLRDVIAIDPGNEEARQLFSKNL